MKEDPRINSTPREQWLHFKEVQQYLTKDPTLCDAIRQSQESIDQFLRRFATKDPRQSDFVLTVVVLNGSCLQPMGIAVDSVDGETVKGRKLRNSLIPSQPGERVVCHLTDIVDWRYTDTFEAVGGRLYRALYTRQHPRIRFDISDHLTFLIERESPVDPEFRAFLQDIANLRYERVREKIEQDQSLLQSSGEMPVLNPGSGRRVTLLPLTAAEYCIMYGDAQMVRIFHEHQAFRESAGDQSPLVDSAWAGNVGTTTCLIDLGFNVNFRDSDQTPLLQAVKWGRLSVVKLLLAKGAEPDLPDIGGKTPLFHAESVDVARELIAAGADVNAINDAGYSCLTTHLEEGHSAIAQLLIEQGADVRADPDTVLEERLSPEESRKLLVEYAKTQHPDEPHYWNNFDYGCVLPVKSIPVNQ